MMAPMRLVVFTDYVYHRADGRVYAERAFALFIAALAEHVDTLTIVGRLAPGESTSHYMLPDEVEFVALPHYTSLMRPLSVFGSLIRSVRRYDKALSRADAAWLLGPYPHALAFAWLTRLRRRRLVLGVRQDFPVYIRSRRPDRRWAHLAADGMEALWRRLARRSPVVVVGADLARQYAGAAAVLEMTVSMVTEQDVAAGERAAHRPYDGELTILSVGRLESEKNPLLLADALASLRADGDHRWRLVVCGDGPLKEPLTQRCRELGVADAVVLRGYVPIDGGLLEAYRQAHVFLHVSFTEGQPQVLTEAFASGVPIVATAVGGVAAAAVGAAVLIPPADVEAAAAAVRRVIDDGDLRAELVNEGLRRARSQTRDAEVARVADFIARG
jgi:glycosyltransferase involved in cell wall biosynthesis